MRFSNAPSISAPRTRDPLSPANTGAPASDSTRIPVIPDDGCQYSPSCLACTLPACKYDMPPGAVKTLRRSYRDQQIAALVSANGWTAAQAAPRLGVTRRTVFRILARAHSTTAAA